jgi:hypothetical protein
LEYYFVLRSVLSAKPHLRPCRRCCRHCGIFFLSDPRNRGRTDLGCPFGCREAHRRKCSNERSTAYNRSPVGKLKKKLRNGKRGARATVKPTGNEPPPPPPQTAGAELDRIEFDHAVLKYLRALTSLIEGRQEILKLFGEAGRVWLDPSRPKEALQGTCEMTHRLLVAGVDLQVVLERVRDGHEGSLVITVHLLEAPIDPPHFAQCLLVEVRKVAHSER